MRLLFNALALVAAIVGLGLAVYSLLAPANGFSTSGLQYAVLSVAAFAFGTMCGVAGKETPTGRDG